MSELNRADLTAGGDAPIVEKTDCADNTISAIELKHSENEAVIADKVSASTLNVQAETQRLAEATNNSLDEKVANSSAKEDAVIVDAQESQVENLTTITLQDQETQSKSANEKKADNSKPNAKDDNATRISNLEAEVRVRKSIENADCPERNESSQFDNEKRTKERDDYRKKLEETETKLTALQASYEAVKSQDNAEGTLQQSVEQLRGQLAQTALMYEERNRVATNQESQINALNNQVASLKEVVSITRDLLQIRNMEVKQLQAEVDNMEKKISEERDRHNVMIDKMDAAMRLNADLKKEYETQLSLFQSLREKYGEKITLLTAEKRALETTSSVPE